VQHLYYAQKILTPLQGRLAYILFCCTSCHSRFPIHPIPQRVTFTIEIVLLPTTPKSCNGSFGSANFSKANIVENTANIASSSLLSLFLFIAEGQRPRHDASFPSHSSCLLLSSCTLHRRSQGFLWGALFLPQKVDDLFSRRLRYTG